MHGFMNVKLTKPIRDFCKRADLKSGVQKNTEESGEISAYVESFSRHTIVSIQRKQ